MKPPSSYEKRPELIYFIQSERGGPVKIGRSKDPILRLRALQTAHPYPLLLLATVEHPDITEMSLHEQFAESRLLGEWFEPTPGLMGLIRALEKAEDKKDEKRRKELALMLDIGGGKLFNALAAQGRP